MGSPSHAASFLIWHCLWHSLPSDFESHDKNHLNGRRWRYLSNYDTPSTRQSKLTTFRPLIWPVLAHRGAEHTRVGYPGWEAKNIQVGLVNLYQILTLRLSDKFMAFIIAEKSTVQIIIERSFFKHMTITPNEEKTHNDYWMVVSLAVDAHERCQRRGSTVKSYVSSSNFYRCT